MMLLENLDAQSLNHWLSRFVVEMQRNDGNPYPPTLISNILAGLYQYCKALVPDSPNFMDKKNQQWLVNVSVSRAGKSRGI